MHKSSVIRIRIILYKNNSIYTIYQPFPIFKINISEIVKCKWYYFDFRKYLQHSFTGKGR